METTAPTGSKPPPSPEAEHGMVLLDLIDVDGLNHRDEDGIRDGVAEKMESMLKHGQLQPVRLYRKPDGRYLLGFGHLRVLGARRLGWKDIRAESLPMPADMREVYDARDRENLDHRTLNPLEEMLLVAQALKRNGGSVEATAAHLGRSPAWVRNRSYVTRLDHVVCELLASRRIEPGHARELAKLGDLEAQREIARAGCRNKDGTGQLRTPDWFRGQVERRRRSLAVIPWTMEAEIAGKRSCLGCPSNSATDATLFEMAGGDASRGYCTNATCFKAKEDAAKELARETAEKVQKRAEATGGMATREMYEKATPSSLKSTAVAAAANLPAPPAKKPATMQRLWEEHAAWSRATFGADNERSPVGPLKHLMLEAEEAIKEVTCEPPGVFSASFRTEVADCLLLLLDAARRGGMTWQDLLEAASAKLAICKQRQYPKPKDGEPSQHVREVARV